MSLNNVILLSDIHNYNFNFKKLFESKDSIIMEKLFKFINYYR